VADGIINDVTKVDNSLFMFDECRKLPNYKSSSVDVTKAYAGEGGYLTLKE
jgi:hypothetical protein